MSGLKQMAECVRAEQRRVIAAAPANRERTRIQRAQQLHERKRRAWRKAGPLLAAALGRQFSPERPTYTFVNDSRGRNDYIRVKINFEGKLDVWVNVYSGSNPDYVYARPTGSDIRAASFYKENSNMHEAVARKVVEWGLS